MTWYGILAIATVSIENLRLQHDHVVSWSFWASLRLWSHQPNCCDQYIIVSLFMSLANSCQIKALFWQGEQLWVRESTGAPLLRRTLGRTFAQSRSFVNTHPLPVSFHQAGLAADDAHSVAAVLQNWPALLWCTQCGKSFANFVNAFKMLCTQYSTDYPKKSVV